MTRAEGEHPDAPETPKSLTAAALRRPVTTMMAFVCLVLVGTISTRLIPLELFPEFDAPVLWINVPYPGSTPEEVERQITRPAEEVLATISGIERLNADARENQAEFFMEFEWGTDTDLKAIEVHEKLDGIRDQLPADIDRIFVGQFSTSDAPILQLRVSSERDLSSAYDLLNRKLKQRLERIDGVSQVELYGVNPREVRIALDADRVAAHRVDLVQLQDALMSSNFSATAGRITDAGRRFTVRPVGELSSIEEIRDLVVAPGVYLSDIAEVTFDDPILDHRRHLNRTYAVGLNVSKESGANTVAVAERIMAALDELEDDPEMQGINLYAMDNAAEGIVSSLRDLLEAGFLGGLFAILVLYFFLRRLSTTLIVALAVPISILVTVGALYFLGLSLNILSMMGLMLAVGMLVDNAVVVTESIHRHQHLASERDDETAHRGDETGSPARRFLGSSARVPAQAAATQRGVRDVALAVTAGTLTTAIVFLPMIVSQADQVTLFLKHVSIAICVALFVSLLLSLTVVPLLTARLKPPRPDHGSDLIQRVTDRYGRGLDWLLRHRKTTAVGILVLLASVLVPGQFVAMDFFPDDQESRELRLHYHLTGTYTLDRVEETVNRVEDYLFANQEAFEIESVYTYFQAGSATSTLILKEDDFEQSSAEIEAAIREGMPKLAIARPSFSWENGGGSGSETVRVTLSGPSSARLAELADDVERVLSRVDGFKDVRSEADAGSEEVRVVVDRTRARQYGFSSQQVAQTVSAALRGRNLRRFRTPDGEVEMRLQFQDADRQTMDDLRTLLLQHTAGEQLPLSAVADLRVVRGPQSIHREDRATMIGVTATLDGITMPEAQQKIGEVLANYSLPAGYAWGYGQRFQQEEESQNIMLMNLLLALALIYLVMAALFESLIHPAAIWTSILFAIVGVFWFFLFTGTTFSIMAWIGVLVLIGVVVNNSIVLIDHVNHLRAQGLARHDAIVQGGMERLRPILMTAATTILGLIPLCIGTTQIGGDGPAYYPMARAIVGGLAFSTFVTLLVLPSIYVMLDDLRLWGRQLARQAVQEQSGHPPHGAAVPQLPRKRRGA